MFTDLDDRIEYEIEFIAGRGVYPSQVILTHKYLDTGRIWSRRFSAEEAASMGSAFLHAALEAKEFDSADSEIIELEF
jgi:hypothetical protein